MKLSHEQGPSGVDWDHATKERGVYRITSKSWSLRVDDELGNYDYLLGVDVRLPVYPHMGDTNRLKVDHNHPEVAKDLLSWGPWVLQVCLSDDKFCRGHFSETGNRTYRQRGEMGSDWTR